MISVQMGGCLTIKSLDQREPKEPEFDLYRPGERKEKEQTCHETERKTDPFEKGDPSRKSESFYIPPGA
jgi:hypothetical protein